MAQVSFEAAKDLEVARSQEGGSFEFFTLRNDGDQAIVRFMYEDTSTFEIFTVHDANVGGKRRKINCIRDPREPITTCPMCASGKTVSNRFFIKMIEYRTNEQNQIIPCPVVWERSLSYATKLKGMLDEYGPLSDCLFKIKRNGAAGSMDTSYEIFFCSPKVYPNEMYPKVDDAFKDVTFLNTLIIDKSREDLEVFINTGSFPSTSDNATSANVAPPQYIPKTDVNVQVDDSNSTPPVATTPTYTPPATNMPPVGAPNATPGRPTRYY